VCAGEVLSRARIGWREERLRLRIFPRFAKLGSRPLSLPSKHKLPRRGSATIHVDQRERWVHKGEMERCGVGFKEERVRKK
jgi:hypothetical protein